MIVGEARIASLGREALQVGEPIQLPHREVKPIGQRSHGLDHGNIPSPGRCNGLHPLWLSQPFLDRKLVEVPNPCAFEARIAKEELNHIAMPGTQSVSKMLDVSLRHGRKPTPLPAKHPA